MWFIIIASVVSLIIILVANRGGSGSGDSFPASSVPTGEAVATYMLNFVDDFMDEKDIHFLNSSPLTRDETAFFATFAIRALALCAIGRGRSAVKFENGFMNAAKKRNSSQFLKMVDERGEFYDRVLASKGNFSKGLSAVFEEFQLVIKYDIMKGKYAPFSESSPLPLLGFKEDAAIQQETEMFHRRLIETMYPVICALEKAFH